MPCRASAAREAALAQALKKLSRLNEEARKLAAAAETALEQAYALAEEARRELDSLLSRLDTDTGALEKKEERLFALRALARKYGVHAGPAAGAARTNIVAKQEALSAGGGQIKTGGGRGRRRARRPISTPRANCPRRATAPPRSWKPPSPANWRR